jgi:hypothetical protein
LSGAYLIKPGDNSIFTFASSLKDEPFGGRKIKSDLNCTEMMGCIKPK